MADFNKAIPHILKHEGGFVNNPNDRGSATNFGVSLRFLKDHLTLGDVDGDGDVDFDDIKNMTVDDAKKVYRAEWWDKFKYGKFVRDDVALKIFDFSINAGAGRAHRMLQECLCDLGHPVTVDGKIGDGTYGATNKFVSDADGKKLLEKFREKQRAFYRELVVNNPKLGDFLKGWLNRVDLC